MTAAAGPDADVDIDRALVATLIAQQHPDLTGELTLVANGWDNVIYRLGESWCVRLPRRQAAVALLRHEQRWLPLLADRATVPIPAPVRAGTPTEAYPYPWLICRWCDGEPASDLPAPARASAAPALAEFLAALHTPAPPEAPVNPVRGVPLDSRSKAVRERLASGRIPGAPRLGALWDRLAATPAWTGPSLWLHGDVHPANLLLRREPGGAVRLAGVIDFGDLTAGDPATDLAAAWLVFDAAGRTAFRTRLAQLRPVDDHTWQRARGWAMSMATAIAAFPAADPRLVAVARHTLDEVLVEEG